MIYREVLSLFLAYVAFYNASATRYREKLFNKLDEGILYNSNVLGNIGDVVTITECATKCTTSDDCRSFVHHGSNAFCRLYDRRTLDPSSSTPYVGIVLFTLGEYLLVRFLQATM